MLNECQKEFLVNVCDVCVKNKIGFLLSNEKLVKLSYEDDSNKSRGFFDEESRTLAVGTKNPLEEWFGILVHEFNHLNQFLEKKFCSKKYVDSSINFWEWLNDKKELSNEKAKTMVNLIREFELDCEKRSYKMIKEMDLGINPEDYIKKANAYMYFYTMVFELKKWYKKPPYAKELVKLMPTEFLDLEEYFNVPDNIRKELKKCF